MNPLILFDYVYYSIAYLYGKVWGYETQKEFVGILFLSLIQFFNVVAILGFIKYSLFELVGLNPLLVTFTGSFVFAILNTIRYKKVVTYMELSKKWNEEKRRNVFMKKAGVIFYIVLTFVLTIYSANIN